MNRWLAEPVSPYLKTEAANIRCCIDAVMLLVVVDKREFELFPSESGFLYRGLLLYIIQHAYHLSRPCVICFVLVVTGIIMSAFFEQAKDALLKAGINDCVPAN